MLLITPPREILGRPIETDFRKWLRFAVMWDSPELLPQEKYALALLNIFGEIPEDADRYMAAVWDFYLCGEQPRETEPPKEKLLDWQADSAAVWADFRIHAGIDLDSARLHWWEFMALFRALPEGASIKQTMGLRAIDLGKIKDAETRAEYARRKRLVALDAADFEDWM